MSLFLGDKLISTDVIIVGGGPAGAACAWRLKKHNVPCLILDKTLFPRAKPCAGWLTPSVFKCLQIDPADYPFDLTKFTTFHIALHRFRFRLRTHQYAIRRAEFDQWLLEKSSAKTYHHEVKHIEKHADTYIIDGQFQAKFLVGAGGTHCQVRKTFFPRGRETRSEGLILAKEEEFQYTSSNKRCRLWFFKDGLPGYAWLVPKVNGYLNVGIGASAVKLRAKGKSLHHYWEDFIAYLEEIGLVKDHNFKPVGYSYYLRQRSPHLQQGNVFLTGDALGLATLDMGEGIRPAIQSGLLVADTINSGKKYSIKDIPRYSFPDLLKKLLE